MIEFCRQTHEYSDEQGKLLGVTSSLAAAGILRAWGTAEDLAFGTRIHQIIHAWFDKDLNTEALGDVEVQYLEGVENFVSETGFLAGEWETVVYDRVHRYGGTFDARGSMRGQRLPVLVDWKSGAVAKWTAIQLALYTLGKPHIRVAVGLGPGLNGGRNYDMKVYGIDTLAAHLQVGLSALRIARYLNGG